MSKMIFATMEKLIDVPAAFLLVTVLVFLAVVAAIAAVSYSVACTQSKKTEMGGIMQVGVCLNRWLDDSKCKDITTLDFGKFWVSMKDPDMVSGKRLNPELNWKERAFSRKYDVSILLRRFLAAYKSAGLADDPSAGLLERLLNDEKFCSAMGKCSYRSDKKGLMVVDAYASKKEANRNRVSVYYAIDGSAYASATGCDAQTICVTLEYRK